MGKYGKIKDGKVTEIYDRRPKWFSEPGKYVTDEYLINHNIYPINMKELSSFDSRRENIHYRSIDDLIIDEEKKIINNYITKKPKSVEDVYDEKIKQIRDIRGSQLQMSIPFNFSDTTYKSDETSYIQVRNEKDINNIQLIGVDAIKHVVEGKSASNFVFRDEDNVNHSIPASEMADMVAKIKKVRQDIYTASWNHESNVKNIIEDEKLTDNEKIDQIVEYDAHVDWPLTRRNNVESVNENELEEVR